MRHYSPQHISPGPYSSFDWISLRDCGEHALIDCKEQVRDPLTADRGLGENVLESKVGEIADKFAGRVGESEGITPEEPLEGNDSGRHNRQPYQRKSRLATRKTRVEEPALKGKRAGIFGGGEVADPYPTPGIIRSTRAVEVIIQAMSPDYVNREISIIGAIETFSSVS